MHLIQNKIQGFYSKINLDFNINLQYMYKNAYMQK